MNNVFDNEQLTDEALIRELPGFANGIVTANGINFHYVSGGSGEVLLLLPGWPETWWSYHKIMPDLAAQYHVIVLDIRGMGSSDKPEQGYEKENMAHDVAAILKALGHTKINIAGHDIGASIAFSFAANYPELTKRLIILDTPPPDENMYKLPMLPIPGYLHPWWLAFNQVKGLPEKLLVGRMHLLLDWIFDQMLIQKQNITEFDRAVYAKTYNTEEGIRASNAWYQAFPKDIEDFKRYAKLEMPVLAIGGSTFKLLELVLPALATNLQLTEIENCGHFIQSDQPEELVLCLKTFLNSPQIDSFQPITS